MGHVVTTPAGSYRANWRDPAGRQRAKMFPTRKAAHAFLAGIESELSRGTYVDPAAGRLVFERHAMAWLAARNDEKTTAARDASIMRHHVLPLWGTTPLARVDHLSVQAWVSDLGSRLAPATVAECLRLTSAVMRSAVRNRLVPANPCEDVKVPRRRTRDEADVLLTREELLDELLPAVPDRYRALVGVAAGAGLRWEECVGLRWDVLDLEAATLRVVRVAVEVSGHVSDKPYPKSRAGRREVPLPLFLVDLLVEHRAQLSPAPDGRVFSNRDGGPLWRGSFRSRVWKPALERAGLPAGLRFHDLRHCYATWLVSDGVPINLVQHVMGHEQASTTLDRYTHAPNGQGDRLRAVFADFGLIASVLR